MSDQVSGVFCIALGIGFAAYLIYGWRKGELRARGISKRSDGPVSWWSAVVTLAILADAAYTGAF